MRRLCFTSDLEEGTLRVFELEAPADACSDPVQADSVLALRRGNAVRVWHNVCPHAGRRLDWAPGRFLRDGEDLVCSHHGAVFELDRGVCISGPCRGASLAALDVTIRDGDVFIEG